MALIKKLVMLVVILLGLILGVWFSAENPQLLTVTVLGFALPQIPAGILLCGVLVIGTALGYVISVLPVFQLKNDNLSLRRKLKRRDKELERLRKTPLKGNKAIERD